MLLSSFVVSFLGLPRPLFSPTGSSTLGFFVVPAGLPRFFGAAGSASTSSTAFLGLPRPRLFATSSSIVFSSPFLGLPRRFAPSAAGLASSTGVATAVSSSFSSSSS